MAVKKTNALPVFAVCFLFSMMLFFGCDITKRPGTADISTEPAADTAAAGEDREDGEAVKEALKILDSLAFDRGAKSGAIGFYETDAESKELGIMVSLKKTRRQAPFW
ncbi:hypothetical protein [Lachnoclostridium sp. Marseille-P6806]|uniref:hypothetical protein n=1 Tax=Lachnoclostridium sp. Marseille-P6806 TaxID=2364793 RepID=UPI0010300D15|nr:hypothetical protein [Lachnoclostridium sp. Marseille-P6806]